VESALSVEESQGSEIVVNVFIHKAARMSRKTFLSRVNRVEAVRTESCCNLLTWHPRDFKEFRFLEHFHAAIHAADFSGFHSESRYVFGISVAPLLYSWFNQNKLTTIREQIINYFAAKYIWEKSQRPMLQDELYRPLFDEIQRVIKTYYPADIESAYKIEADNWETDPPKAAAMATHGFERLKADYAKASINYTGAPPPEIFKDFHDRSYWNLPDSEAHLRQSWGITGGRDCEFNFCFEQFYFTRTDWEEIIIKGDPDELRRREARSDLWEKWKLTFDRYEQTKNHVFQLTSEVPQKGFVYVFQEGTSKVRKVGFTHREQDVENRRKAAQPYSHEVWSTRGYFPVASQNTETVIHNILKKMGCHIRGELFSLTEEQVTDLLDDEWRRRNNIF
jgi:hypothetical protein